MRMNRILAAILLAGAAAPICVSAAVGATPPVDASPRANAASAPTTLPARPAPPAYRATLLDRAIHAPAAAPQPAPRKLKPSPLSAEQVVERSVRASGGIEAWHTVATMSLSGMMDAGPKRAPTLQGPTDRQHEKAQVRAEARKVLLKDGGRGADSKVEMIALPFTMEMKRGGKQRVEVQFQGQSAVQVYDGKQGWKVRPFLNRHEVEPFTAEQQKLAAEQQDLDGPLVDYAKKGTRIAIEGIETLDSGDAYALKLTLKDGSTRHVWVDTKSFLQVQVDGTRRVNGHEVPLYTHFDDYRAVRGVMVPFMTVTHVQGAPYSEKIVLDKVAVNPPLADTRFARPL